MDTIRDGDSILAIIYRDSDWRPGLNFPTPEQLFVQAGCWQYEAGRQLQAHRHIFHERRVTMTQEVTYVKRGRIKVTVYNHDNQIASEFELNAGDFAVLAYGGHGYEILEDNTQVLEVKNGPFIDVASDKENL